MYDNSFKEANLIIKGFISITKYYEDLHSFLKVFSNTYQCINIKYL